MKIKPNAFTVTLNGKIVDYRVGTRMSLSDIQKFFAKQYKVHRLWNVGRHIVGIVEKNKKLLLLKLATSEGISALTQNEYYWNQSVNSLLSRKIYPYWIPQNYDCGFYNSTFFYLVTEYFDGSLLAQGPNKEKISPILKKAIPSIIDFSELIQQLDLPPNQLTDEIDFRKYFIDKTSSWYEMIPETVRQTYALDEYLTKITKGASLLNKRTRHGDFTPWHLMNIQTSTLLLLDGEHAKKNGVEYYDIAYFIQRIFSELQQPDFAKYINSILLRRGYSKEKLILVLQSRAIGGFLDESLKEHPTYETSNSFLTWSSSL